MAESPEPSNVRRVYAPEMAPSEITAEEPTLARALGFGGALFFVIGLAAWFRSQSVLGAILPQVFAFPVALIGLGCMLLHAARDGDRLVRRTYQALGLATVVAGLVCSVIPQPTMGDWLMPWGLMGLGLGLILVLAAWRTETEPNRDAMANLLLSGLGVAMTAVGLIGVTASIEHLPKFSGVAVMGLAYWWAGLGRLGSSSDRGYQMGRLLGLVGLAALLFAIVRSGWPMLANSFHWTLQPAESFFIPRGFMLGLLGAIALLLSIGLCSDRPVVAMTRRELSAYFYSPVAYIVLLGMTAIGWASYELFFSSMMDATRDGTVGFPEPIVRHYAINFFPVISLMFAVPAVTMGLLSEENRSGTFEVLMTGPVSEWQVVWSKFSAAMLFLMFLVLPWGAFLVPIYLAGRDGFDYLPLLNYMLALLATGSAFLSMGLLMSSLTRNQIIAAVLAFFGMVVFLLPYFLANIPSFSKYESVLSYVAFIDVWSAALAGKLQISRLAMYLSMSAFFLYVTTKVLEARKWS